MADIDEEWKYVWSDIIVEVKLQALCRANIVYGSWFTGYKKKRHLIKYVESVRKTGTNTTAHVCESTKNMATTRKLIITVITIILKD